MTGSADRQAASAWDGQWSRLGAMAALVAMAAATAGCAPQRSVESFCSTYWNEKTAYVDKYERAADGVRAVSDQEPLLGLLSGTAMLAQASGDVIVIFDKLDKVAPDDIEPDVAAIRDTLKSQAEKAPGAISDPLGTIVGGLVQSLMVSGSWQRVGDYVITNCGEQG